MYVLSFLFSLDSKEANLGRNIFNSSMAVSFIINLFAVTLLVPITNLITSMWAHPKEILWFMSPDLFGTEISLVSFLISKMLYYNFPQKLVMSNVANKQILSLILFISVHQMFSV